MNRESQKAENAGNMPNGLSREKILPGVAPCASNFQKNGENRQRQNLKKQKIRRKRLIFQRLFVLETSQTPLWTLRQVLDNFTI